MKLTQRDLRKLLPPLLATLALCTAAGTLTWWSHTETRDMLRERDRAAEGKTRIEARLRQFRSEEIDLKERSLLFKRLQEAGILGEEHRLDWIEQLRNTQHDLHLPGLKYEFAVQAPLNQAAPSGYAWFNSPLRLHMSLLHEGDLLSALERIQREAHALVIVRTCRLVPTATSERKESVAFLNADCDMDWMTARRPSGRN